MNFVQEYVPPSDSEPSPRQDEKGKKGKKKSVPSFQPLSQKMATSPSPTPKSKNIAQREKAMNARSNKVSNAVIM